MRSGTFTKRRNVFITRSGFFFSLRGAPARADFTNCRRNNGDLLGARYAASKKRKTSPIMSLRSLASVSAAAELVESMDEVDDERLSLRDSGVSHEDNEYPLFDLDRGVLRGSTLIFARGRGDRL